MTTGTTYDTPVRGVSYVLKPFPGTWIDSDCMRCAREPLVFDAQYWLEVLACRACGHGEGLQALCPRCFEEVVRAGLIREGAEVQVKPEAYERIRADLARCLESAVASEGTAE